MNKIIAIQGAEGSNHHKVARDFYGDNIQLKECMSFDALVAHLLEGSATDGVMAIENTIAGSIIPNYALIDSNNLHIVGEEYLNIHHHLMALPGQTIKSIKEVWSHPMALLQCKEFFKQYPHIKLIEDTDTAEVAKRIHEGQIKGVAAIASLEAASLFTLDILAESIQTIKHNETRFVIVERAPKLHNQDAVNKASVKFLLDHKRGSLAAMLNVMSDCNLNLTKIQSLPKIDTPWKYAFFADFIFDSYADYYNAICEVKNKVETLTVLGEYNKSKR